MGYLGVWDNVFWGRFGTVWYDFGAVLGRFWRGKPSFHGVFCWVLSRFAGNLRVLREWERGEEVG